MKLWYYWYVSPRDGKLYPAQSWNDKDAIIDARKSDTAAGNWMGPLRSVTIIRDTPKPKQPSRAKRTRRDRK